MSVSEPESRTPSTPQIVALIGKGQRRKRRSHSYLARSLAQIILAKRLVPALLGADNVNLTQGDLGVKPSVLLIFFGLFVPSVLSCSSDQSFQELQEAKSAESNGEDDISVEDGVKTIREYGRWALQGFVDDPIEEKEEYFIMTYSDHYEEMRLVVQCSGFIWIAPNSGKRLLLNYRGSSESDQTYAFRAKWGSGMEKRIDKIWAFCEQNTDCQVLVLFPSRDSSFKELMTTYDKLMLEVKVIQGGSEALKHYTFDLDGFTEASDALLAKGCKPILEAVGRRAE